MGRPPGNWMGCFLDKPKKDLKENLTIGRYVRHKEGSGANRTQDGSWHHQVFPAFRD